ncbi:Alcohol acyltransferase 9 [Stylosanthes scabra]|uniref:Alcohol acyltransferase 9 n=1 Tax=Stylosanthes scabra TaxID=79078 RepID=A0ABU6R3B3_9FABA|nr:Alcohol acyltransferase 9 [Stylosanthes scabra]
MAATTTPSSVRVKEALLVTPSDPTPTGILHLSAIDSQLFLRFTVEYLFVYRPPSALHQASVVTRVKSALARALVPYYPFSGRVRPRADVTGGLEVVCRGQGALFIEAFSDVYTAKDFDKAPKTVTQWRKLLSLYVPDVLKGSPPLVVQLTWLADGAAAVGVGINHALCDGIGSAEFLNYFAKLASGPRDFDPKPRPVWDRHIMNPPPSKKNDRAKGNSHAEFARVPDLCGFMNKVTTGLRPTSIVFNKRRINELKGIARYSSESSSSSYTSFEVIAAHVWRSWARALGFPPNQQLKMLFSINVRNRVKPNLPEGYYGNAFVLGCAQSSAKELSEKGIGYGSGLVKRAKERVDGEYVRRVSELVSEWRASPDPVGVLIVSQWSRLGLERVEFMGRPIHVGPICWDRYCLFLPVRDEAESVRVAVAVPTAAFDSYHRFIGESNL